MQHKHDWRRYKPESPQCSLCYFHILCAYFTSVTSFWIQVSPGSTPSDLFSRVWWYESDNTCSCRRCLVRKINIKPSFVSGLQKQGSSKHHHYEIKWVLCSHVTELGAGDPVPSSPSPAGLSSPAAVISGLILIRPSNRCCPWRWMGLLWACLHNSHRMASLPHEHRWESREEQRKALDLDIYTV